MFDIEDFKRDPDKYRRFQSARVAEPVCGLAAGLAVRIAYYGTQVNAMRGGKPMPLYQVWPQDELSQEPSAILFACALKDFSESPPEWAQKEDRLEPAPDLEKLSVVKDHVTWIRMRTRAHDRWLDATCGAASN